MCGILKTTPRSTPPVLQLISFAAAKDKRKKSVGTSKVSPPRTSARVSRLSFYLKSCCFFCEVELKSMKSVILCKCNISSNNKTDMIELSLESRRLYESFPSLYVLIKLS